MVKRILYSGGGIVFFFQNLEYCGMRDGVKYGITTQVIDTTLNPVRIGGLDGLNVAYIFILKNAVSEFICMLHNKLG